MGRPGPACPVGAVSEAGRAEAGGWLGVREADGGEEGGRAGSGLCVCRAFSSAGSLARARSRGHVTAGHISRFIQA